MERNIMIAGSYPTIITSGGNPRVNKELIDNMFLKTYVSILGDLLKIKGKLSDIKIIYIGGYAKEENISRAKLYISAYNYYLNYLGYESLNKNNLTVIDEDNIDDNLENIEQCDLLFLGIGADSKVASVLSKLEDKKIYINELIREKNILVSSICSGSVMSAERIYGGRYDNYYYNKEQFSYPLNIPSLRLNPVTMETDFEPNDATIEKNQKFINGFLKPDSKKCLFFACKPNSLFLIGTNKIYAYGEIYLFIDGEYLLITSANQKADVTELVTLVNEYNKIKNGVEFIDVKLTMYIKNAISQLDKRELSEQVLETLVIKEFEQKEKANDEKKQEKVRQWRQNLMNKLEFLFSQENLGKFRMDLKTQDVLKRLTDDVKNSYNVDSTQTFLEELYLRMNIVSIIKKAYFDYNGFYSDFKKDLYIFLDEYVSYNDKITYYVLDTCGCLFSNNELKQLLKKIKMENLKRAQQIINTTDKRLNLFRKEIKYARS